MNQLFDLTHVHPTWIRCIQNALTEMNPDYLNSLYNNNDWLPGRTNIFNAFSIPISNIRYVLFGESPYPRAQSANGYAFWDASVTDLWSEHGLSKHVNRATSLRNLIKMLLVAEGLSNPDETTPAHISSIEKKNLIKTNTELFENFIQHGFLLLNASLVLQKSAVSKDAKEWQPFMSTILDHLYKENPKICLILFGNIANKIEKFIKHKDTKKLYAEHPYNHSFIKNKNVIEFFKTLHLLKNNSK